MFKTRINNENEEKLRTIYQKEGYMKKAVNLAVKEYFNNYTKEEILKQLQEAKQ
jgi:hypothetical protein